MRVPPSLTHRRFRLLWSGLLISVAGSQMQLWALFWHIRTLTDQPIAISGIGLVRFLPILAFSLLGGLVADRFDRRRVLFITQTTSALVALTLGILTLRGDIRLWHFYMLTAIQAVAISFDLPARQSLVPRLVPAQDLANAFSLQSIAFDVGSIAGPALSGLVIAYAGQHFTYLINSASFLAVIYALIRMGPVPNTDTSSDSSPAQKAGLNLASILEGIRFIRRQPVILGSMLLDFFAVFFSSANTLLPYVARDILHVGSIQYGWLSAAQSIGAVTAALVISQRARIRRQGALLLGAVAIFGLATMAFGLARSFWLTMGALIVAGAADSVSTIIRNTARQILTPDYLRGRMVSVTQIFFAGGPQLGEIEAGLVAQAFSVPIAIVTGGVGCLLALAWVSARWPQLARYDGGEH